MSDSTLSDPEKKYMYYQEARVLAMFAALIMVIGAKLLTGPDEVVLWVGAVLMVWITLAWGKRGIACRIWNATFGVLLGWRVNKTVAEIRVEIE